MAINLGVCLNIDLTLTVLQSCFLSELQVMKDDGNITKYWIRLGDSYASEEEFSEAENCYLKAEAPKKAIDMYAVHGKRKDDFLFAI